MIDAFLEKIEEWVPNGVGQADADGQQTPRGHDKL